MKKLLAVLLIAVMIMALAACGGSKGTVGENLSEDFLGNAEGTTQEIAERLLENDVIEFEGVAMPMVPGYLAGFDNVEIKEFKDCTMFAPMMGTIPFVGYIFELEEGTDVEAFKQNLEANANLRWNICTEAEELVVENVGNKVLFLMCPASFDDAQ